MSKKIFRTIAVFTAECSMDEEYAAVSGVCAQAEKIGWRVLVFDALNNFRVGSSNSILGTNIYKLLDFDTVSGVLITQNVMNDSQIGRQLVELCDSHNVPVISMGYKSDLCPSYVFSSADVLEQIVSHVIEKHNCSTLNLVAGIQGNAFSEQRVQAFKNALIKHGLSFDERRLFYGGFWEGPTKEGMKNFFETGLPLPDAFICCNDLMAMTVCQELALRGYSVPNDVIVTGYDGIEFEQYHAPRLTTAKCDMNLLGKKSLLSLVSLIEGNEIPQVQFIDPTLIFSQSCGCRAGNTLAQDNFALKVMSLIGNSRHRTSMLHKFATLTSEIKNLDDIKPLLPDNDFYGKDCWIMINQNFLQVGQTGLNQQESGSDEPYSEEMDCFWRVIGDVEMPHAPVKRWEYIPEIEKVFDLGLTNLVFFDLHFGDDSIGYMVSSFVDRNPSFTLSSMERFSQSFSQCCSLVKNRSRLEHLNSHDQLTGILNRRGFYAEIEDKIKKIGAKDTDSISLIVHSIDMDELKHINDTFGHSEGDFAIKTLSEAIVEAGGENIVPARFGGDEFVAAEIASGNTGKLILDFRDKIHAFLDKVNKSSGKPFKVSASLGTYTAPLPLQLRIDQIIAQADALMYQEKSTKKGSR